MMDVNNIVPQCGIKNGSVNKLWNSTIEYFCTIQVKKGNQS